MITDAQRKTLQFIEHFINTHGFAPKLPEIAEGIGIESTGTVHRYVQALQDEGLIEITPRVHRGISLVSQEANEQAPAANSDHFEIPLLGKIAAGQPIEAIPDQQSIALDQLFSRKNCFALQVQGDSMIEAGILDGDMVICESRNQARNGQIVVALVDNSDVTLKYIHHNPEDKTITLIPANARLSPMVYAAEQITIQGILVAQIRSY